MWLEQEDDDPDVIEGGDTKPEQTGSEESTTGGAKLSNDGARDAIFAADET